MMNRNEHEEEHHEDLRVEEPRRIPMLEYAQPSLDGARPSIVRPTVRANQFEIKPALIQMIQNTVQFGGNALDDSNTHIADFLEICDTFKFNGVSDDAIRLRSITTWEDMAKEFLLKYFSPSKTMKLRADITTFSQFEQESLYEASERYKDLLRRCPHHELPLGIHQVTDFSAVTAQLEALNRKIDSMNVNGTAMRLQEIFCEKCGEHYVKDCQDSGHFYVNEEASFISATETRLQNQDASIKGLEKKIGQLAKMITSREPGTLPSNTETNPKEQVKAILLRSGKVLEKEDQREEAVDISPGKSSKSTPALTTQAQIAIPQPFPAALKKAKLDAKFGKFLEVFKKLHINVPFANALLQMPIYAKFLNDILANKGRLEDHMTINLIENCSALVQNKIPPKLKDPGSFSIPCVIGEIFFIKLCVILERV
ncbi:uncharacterized protein [Primulina huaijiensis]|uniref:uncharacterized protein n=1 Tax=Primulina huaijiensis TaxID=1492673 RepID=UPI003CC6F19D